MTETLFLWLFAYAFVWWLLWFLVLPIRTGSKSQRHTKGEGDFGETPLQRKAIVVSLAAALLTTLLLLVPARLL